MLYRLEFATFYSQIPLLEQPEQHPQIDPLFKFQPRPRPGIRKGSQGRGKLLEHSAIQIKPRLP